MTHEASEAARKIAAEVLGITNLDQKAKEPRAAALVLHRLIQASLVAAYEAGRSASAKDAWESGQKSGHTDGYNTGFAEGKNVGYAVGRNDGFAEGCRGSRAAATATGRIAGKRTRRGSDFGYRRTVCPQ